MGIIVRAVAIGMVIVLVGTIPRNIAFLANLQFLPSAPWAVPVVGVYMWFFWRYVSGAIGAPDTADFRRTSLRANRITGRAWVWALAAGGLGIVALVLGLRVANRLVDLPTQPAPDFSQVPWWTVLALLVAAAPVAGIIEEAAFRGYMQGPIERRFGPAIAILITGTMFAVAHLDFTLVLWPYYVAVAAVYGMVTYLTGSILPAIVLHTSGNIYSNLDLWRTGRAEWQAARDVPHLVWSEGADSGFVIALVSLALVSAAAVWTYARLARVCRGQASEARPIASAISVDVSTPRA